MATNAEMGEIDNNDSNEETATKDISNINGEAEDSSIEECDDISQNSSEKFIESSQIDIDQNSVDRIMDEDDEVENIVDSCEEGEVEDSSDKMEVQEIDSDDQEENDEVHEIDDASDDDDERDNSSIQNGLDGNEEQINDNVVDDSGEEVVLLDDKDSEETLEKDGLEIINEKSETIVLDDNKDSLENGNDSSDDLQIAEDKDDNDVITLEEDSPKKPKKSYSRNLRNVKQKKRQRDETSEESDIEEVLPEDPLAVTDDAHPVLNSSSVQISRVSSNKKARTSSSTIVVKDTKCLAEIASKSTNSNSKKEPTLVIIDTNSILSGRGPVPVPQKPPVSTPVTTPISNSFSMIPMALPAQGVYPANMRATITPIPMTSSVSTTKSSPVAPVQPSQQVLPTLSDDMFVVEAPSFIVPYVYEKPPIKDLQEFLKTLEREINEQNKKEKEKGESSKESTEKKDEKKDSNEAEKDNAAEKENLIDLDSDEKSSEKITSIDLSSSSTPDLKKSTSYFDSPLGKFFMGIGYSLVQESVQSDLLKQQKKRRDREGNQNPETVKTINSLLKNLEFSKENNEPFRMPTKKCEFCSFKTESVLVMAHHLETPHMKNYVYRCNFCTYEVRSPHDILFHMEVQHGVRGRLERAPAFHQCPSCTFEDNQKGKLSRHLVSCARKFKPDRNLEPPVDYDPPAKIPRAPRMKQQGLGNAAAVYQAMARNSQLQMMSKLSPSNLAALQRQRGRPTLGTSKQPNIVRPTPSNLMYKQANVSGGSVLVPTNYQMSGNQLYQQQVNAANKLKSSQQPSISITPLPRGSSGSGLSITKPGDSNSKNSFVICEICDGYIKDLEQLRNHMQWIHKVKIHPKMIYNRPPLNCQKCQFRFFTDQGLERHLLGSHGLVTSSMQEAANKSKDAGRCPVCGRVYQWKLLNHVARDHNMTLKPAHLSYKCTVCTATFGMYKQFESHVYSAHSVVAKKVMDKKNTSASGGSKTESVLKPLKINDEITIIPQPAKSTNGTFTSKEGSPSTSGTSISVRSASGFSNGTPGTSKREGSSSPSLNHSERFAHHKTINNDN